MMVSKPLDLLAHGRLGHMECLSGAGESLLVDHGQTKVRRSFTSMSLYGTATHLFPGLYS